MPDKRNTDYDIFKKLPLKIVVVNLPKKCKF